MRQLRSLLLMANQYWQKFLIRLGLREQKIITKKIPSSWLKMRKVSAIDIPERAAYDNSSDLDLEYPDW